MGPIRQLLAELMPSPPLVATRSDLPWYTYVGSGITEVTVALPEYLHLFINDKGTVRHPPERREGSHYWKLVDLVLSKEFRGRVHQLVRAQYPEQGEMSHIEVGGVQIAHMRANSERSLHFDHPDIAALLFTATVEGSARISLEGVDHLGGALDEQFDQERNEGYLLYGTATTDTRHGIVSGAAGRVAVTFRYSLRSEARP